MTAGLHCFVSGTVQGVFFRQSTRAQALALKLTGWVRNLEDGRVEVRAYGESVILQQLRDWLHHGPPRAAVTQVDCRTVEYSDENTDFQIVR